jgi:arsenate reductase
MCPVWPGQPRRRTGAYLDPAAAEGSDENKRKQFTDAAYILKRRIELMLSLPLAGLDAMSLQNELKNIGTS